IPGSCAPPSTPVGWHCGRPPRRRGRTPYGTVNAAAGRVSVRLRAMRISMTEAPAGRSVRHSTNHPSKEGVLRVSSRILVRRVLSPVLLSLLAAAAAVVPPTVSASEGSGGARHVYVNDNTAGSNTIAVFDRHANGILTPVA